MTFLHPALVWGSSLVAVPIIIYLWQRHRLKEIEWAAMRFLLDIIEEQQRRITLEDLLLLLLRCLMILFLALAVSRPLFRTDLNVIVGSGDTAVLLDASYSMATRAGAVSRWQLAKDACLRVLDEQPRGFGVSLLTVSRRSQVIAGDFGGDRALVRETLKRLDSSALAGDPAAALAQAVAMFQASRHVVKRLYLVSDFQVREWQRPDKEVLDAIKQLRKLGCEIVFIPVFDAQTENLAAVNLRLVAGGVRVGTRTRVLGEIVNHGKREARDVAVDFLVDGRTVENRTLDVMPGQPVHLAFAFVPDRRGFHQACLRIRSDALASDNRCWLGFRVTDAVPILAVDEAGVDAEGVKPTDLLELALAPFRDRSENRDAVYRVRHITGDQLSAEALEDYRVVCLANLPGVTRAEAGQLEDYVRHGGGVLVFLGEQTRPEFWNQNLCRQGEGLLPWPLADEVLEWDGGKRPLVFSAQHVSHPVWKSLITDRVDHFTDVRFYRAFTCKRGEPKRVLELATVAAGEGKPRPFILDVQLGRGHALFVGSSLAPRLNNWAAHTAFVTFINEAVRFLGSFRQGRTRVQAGDRLLRAMDFRHSQSSYRVMAPGGDATMISVLERDEDYYLETPPLLESGIWEFVNRDDGNDRFLVACNVDPAEGDIRAMNPDELATIYGPHGVRVKGSEQDDDADKRGAWEIASLLLVLMLLCWLGENLLAYRISRR